MQSEKKLTKEDTWRPAELRRHIREKDSSERYSRHREDTDRTRREGESMERRHRDPDREKLKEKKLRHGDTGDRYAEQKKDRSYDRRSEKDRERRGEEERKKQVGDARNYRETILDKEYFREREKQKDRHKYKEKDREKVRERHSEDWERRREDREKERRREEREKEHRRERRRHDESEVRRDQTEKLHREPGDRQHRGTHDDRRRDKDIQEAKRRSEQSEDRDKKQEHRRNNEERERRHKERRHHDEKDERESKERREFKKTDDEVRNSHGNRKQTEREKQKERHKKEEEGAERRHKDRGHSEVAKEDLERDHGEKRSSRKSQSDKSLRHEKMEEETKDDVAVSKQQMMDGKNGGEHVEKAELAEEEYEEDFEDYEEDFEDLDESAEETEDEVHDGKEEQTAQPSKEIESIRRAMAEENERAGTAQSRRSIDREEEEHVSKGSERNQSKISRHGKFIDFVAAKQREVSQKAAAKQKKRGAELLHLIDLDFSLTCSLLDIPPVSEYEMYIKSFGNANTKQAYVQCNEDNTDRDVQTEEIEICEKWTQHPPEFSGACGDPNFSQEAQDKTRDELILDSQQLMSFLDSASQVMVVLLEEDQAERKSLRKLTTQTDSLSFSDGSLQLNTTLPFLSGRQISLVHFSQGQKHTMLSVHMPKVQASTPHLDSCSMVCVWNIWEPSRPQKILIYEAEIQCCCFSPGKSTLVFAGTQVGSVVLWDLRENSSNHYKLKIGEDEWTFRHPTFSTDAVMSSPGHASPVASVEVIPSFVAGGLRAEVPLLAFEEGLSFQLASLDESGMLNIWVVVELPKGNEAGSLTDLGLRPGGKVKLLHSSSLLTVQRPLLKVAGTARPFQTMLLKYHPTDSNQFFIGTNLGLVSHGTSHGLKTPPQFYGFQEVEERTVDINSIHFSPFRPNLFLVGCADGSIRLHTVNHEQPVAEWKNSTAGEPVISAQWAQTRPAIFSVLDAASNLHIWDMMKDDAQPLITKKMSTDGVTAMAVFGDSGHQNTYSGIALAHESGKIELHYFTPTLTVLNPTEEKKLESIMTEAF
ncbi:cytoplasmic dynein 2 intermediate chain 1 isoform X2 [Cyprinodon tularosa]|uniref:cytoplasmic dynein 2 intermediate chain 1 isoform X2 n=1 Tax=Cyprinodon tularosa TaxID=77115 RepID=UPI0018E230F7|nr:cytoplasmic dynein 2 intermediate chain 1 isoform X2 [Cyprinodon tularosa]